MKKGGIERRSQITTTTESHSRTLVISASRRYQKSPIRKKCDFQLICKWGCDGTSGQSMFKQKFHDDDGTKTDANMFVTSLVPLQLVFADAIDNHNRLLWKNPRPSSPRFCRPIKIQFLHETAESKRAEVDYIKDQEKIWLPFQTVFVGKQINVSYKIVLTMIDGKVCNSSHTRLLLNVVFSANVLRNSLTILMKRCKKK